jgi:hypothetical protein
LTISLEEEQEEEEEEDGELGTVNFNTQNSYVVCS